MINNRQGGRRRGRGGGAGRPPNMNSGAGNRQDNRQRGNAAQLLEKYKGLARDMQMQGDRVQTEYYLQFADHYYRLLNENRARFDEQRRQRDDGGYDASYEDEDQDEMVQADAGERQSSEEMDARGGDGRREERVPRNEERASRNEERASRNGEYRARRPRGRHPETEEDADEGEERIAFDSLPPAISPATEEAEEPVRAPRRRPRRPREPGEEIAPAA